MLTRRRRAYADTSGFRISGLSAWGWIRRRYVRLVRGECIYITKYIIIYNIVVITAVMRVQVVMCMCVCACVCVRVRLCIYYRGKEFAMRAGGDFGGKRIGAVTVGRGHSVQSSAGERRQRRNANVPVSCGVLNGGYSAFLVLAHSERDRAAASHGYCARRHCQRCRHTEARREQDEIRDQATRAENYIIIYCT